MKVLTGLLTLSTANTFVWIKDKTSTKLTAALAEY